ncbi:MAG: hypothetical protein WA919_16190 [Coleofasciculaceae cyanobacterium]
MNCVSSPGKGTEFIVQIPVHQKHWSLDFLQKPSRIESI